MKCIPYSWGGLINVNDCRAIVVYATVGPKTQNLQIRPEARRNANFRVHEINTTHTHNVSSYLKIFKLLPVCVCVCPVGVGECV